MMGLQDSVVVCRCEGTTAGEVRASIRRGARTVNEMKRRTRVCMGFCQGQNCTDMLRDLLAELTGQPLAAIYPGTPRPPVRLISVASLTEAEQD